MRFKLLLFCIEEETEGTDVKDLALILFWEWTVVPGLDDRVAKTDKLNRLNFCRLIKLLDCTWLHTMMDIVLHKVGLCLKFFFVLFLLVNLFKLFFDPVII